MFYSTNGRISCVLFVFPPRKSFFLDHFADKTGIKEGRAIFFAECAVEFPISENFNCFVLKSFQSISLKVLSACVHFPCTGCWLNSLLFSSFKYSFSSFKATSAHLNASDFSSFECDFSLFECDYVYSSACLIISTVLSMRVRNTINAASWSKAISCSVICSVHITARCAQFHCYSEFLAVLKVFKFWMSFF